MAFFFKAPSHSKERYLQKEHSTKDKKILACYSCNFMRDVVLLGFWHSSL